MNQQGRQDSPPLATENAELSPEESGVSTIGETHAMRRAVAAEAGGTDESGSNASQQEYLARDARVTDEMREERAKKADINNDVNDQAKNDR